MIWELLRHSVLPLRGPKQLCLGWTMIWWQVLCEGLTYLSTWMKACYDSKAPWQKLNVSSLFIFYGYFLILHYDKKIVSLWKTSLRIKKMFPAYMNTINFYSIDLLLSVIVHLYHYRCRFKTEQDWRSIPRIEQKVYSFEENFEPHTRWNYWPEDFFGDHQVSVYLKKDYIQV